MSVTTTGSTCDPTGINDHFNTDVAIYNQRILYVVDRTISKVKLVKFIVAVVNGYESEWLSTIPIEKKEIFERVKKRYEKMEQAPVETGWKAKWSIVRGRTEDNDIMRILQFLDEYGDSDLINQYIEDDKVSHFIDLFVSCLEELKVGVELHQKEDASKEKAREKYLKRCQIKNEQARKEIAILEEELIAKKSDLNASIIGKNLMINRHQSKIDKIQKISKEAIEQRIADSERIMEADRKACEGAIESLEAELQTGTIKYEEALKEHLAINKQLRLQRTKVENQLVAWMEKFDQDMSDKQQEEEELQAEFEEERKKYEDIQKKLDEQEEEYDELMQEKAAYEQELLEQKLFIFILNRSARRIQRAFRAYKLRKMAKKKSKKGKKGKGKKK